MNKYLVTGGSGYVGREVIQQLLENGKDVTALDLVPPDQAIPFVQVDLTDAEALEKAFQDKSFDCILHIASLPGDTGNPQQMVQVNVNGCLNMLELARRMGAKRYVQTSSISAYEWYPATKFNPPDYMPVDENHPLRPKDMYSSTKQIQEILAMTYFHQYGVPTTVLRLTAVVGPHGRGGGRGYREMAEQIRQGTKVQIPHFSADELCHYVDVRDVARMQIVLSEHPNAVGEIFLCVGPRPVTGIEFVEIIRKYKPGIQSDFGFPWSMAQGGQIAFTMEKAKRLLDFEPCYSLEDSIYSIVHWVESGGLEAEEKTSADRTYGQGVNQG
ncbi:MAG: NAD(P)-dependent oxidoreductase [Chloroflexi bacterium]|nr:MAG: NAD(P)-dependent oxidoreductase [Chloroflexota bacterium]